jgi:hypothetical protein
MPTVIYSMLKEEKQRNLEMQETYKQEIEALRKGSIWGKSISGRTYYYLRYRQGEKVKNDYIGKDKSVIEEIKREIEKRKYLQGVLKRLKVEYRQINLIVKD